jgi:phosphoglycolate phosphatase
MSTPAPQTTTTAPADGALVTDAPPTAAATPAPDEPAPPAETANSAAAPDSPQTIGVVFDVDGTLLTGSGANLRALTAAAASVLGSEVVLEVRGEVPHLGEQPVPGWIDVQMLDHLARAAGRDLREVHDELLAVYAAAYRDDLSGGASAGTLLPGVLELLTSLQGNGVPVGLATGNVAEVARAKMAAHALEGFFDFDPAAGFSDWRLTRLEVGQAAVTALGAVDQVYLVGDTVADMWSAQLNGAFGVGVLTGAASERELRAAGAWAVLPDVTALVDVLPAASASVAR